MNFGKRWHVCAAVPNSVRPMSLWRYHICPCRRHSFYRLLISLSDRIETFIFRFVNDGPNGLAVSTVIDDGRRRRNQKRRIENRNEWKRIGLSFMDVIASHKTWTFHMNQFTIRVTQNIIIIIIQMNVFRSTQLLTVFINLLLYFVVYELI